MLDGSVLDPEFGEPGEQAFGRFAHVWWATVRCDRAGRG
jgi:hypothetical protein